MDGLISTFAHGKGRASNDRQFLYINRRPCNLPKVCTPVFLIALFPALKLSKGTKSDQRGVQNLQHQSISLRYCEPLTCFGWVLLNLNCLHWLILMFPDAYDINVSPDKRTIFLHNEENLMISLRVRCQFYTALRGTSHILTLYLGSSWVQFRKFAVHICRKQCSQHRVIQRNSSKWFFSTRHISASLSKFRFRNRRRKTGC